MGNQETPPEQHQNNPDRGERLAQTERTADARRAELRDDIGAREDKEVTVGNLDELAETAEGRSRIRAVMLDRTGRVKLTSKDPRYSRTPIHYMYHYQPIWINGKKAVYADGKDGFTYYDDQDIDRTRRVHYRTGDRIALFDPAGKVTVSPAPTPKQRESATRRAERVARASVRPAPETLRPALEKLRTGPAWRDIGIKSEKDYRRVSQSADGREKIRSIALDAAQRLRIQPNDPLYRHMALTTLYQGTTTWINDKKALYTSGRHGMNYYYEDDKKHAARVTIKTGDLITTQPRAAEYHTNLGLTREEERRLANYTDAYHQELQTHNIFNRTFEHRLKDHENLLTDIFASNNGQPNTSPDFPHELGQLRAMLRPNYNQKFTFIDIGPGIANVDLKFKGGKGRAAVTTQEMAERFPGMTNVVLDLPSEVSIFTGEKPLDNGKKFSEQRRRELLAHRNIHIVSGDGLLSLKDQYADTRTNPYPDRQRPAIDNQTTLIIRSANAIDIYCKWQDVRPALERTARDFYAQPVMYFFNREILIKPANSAEWSLIGQVSDRGFRHQGRDLNLRGQKSYWLDASAIARTQSTRKIAGH